MLWHWLIGAVLRLLGAGKGSERSVIRGPPGLDHQAEAAAPGYYGRKIPRTKGVRSRATVLQMGAVNLPRS
jgi:hypothetical protein